MPDDKPALVPLERAIRRLEEGLARYLTDTSDTQIRDGLKGNLCRCTGYANVVQAVHAAAAAGEGS